MKIVRYWNRNLYGQNADGFNTGGCKPIQITTKQRYFFQGTNKTHVPIIPNWNVSLPCFPCRQMSHPASVPVGFSNAPVSSVRECLILMEFNWNSGRVSHKYGSRHGNRVEGQVLGAFAKLRRATTTSVMSVRPSAWNSSAPTGRILMKLDIWAFFENVWKNSSFIKIRQE